MTEVALVYPLGKYGLHQTMHLLKFGVLFESLLFWIAKKSPKQILTEKQVASITTPHLSRYIVVKSETRYQKLALKCGGFVKKRQYSIETNCNGDRGKNQKTNGILIVCRNKNMFFWSTSPLSMSNLEAPCLRSLISNLSNCFSYC